MIPKTEKYVSPKDTVQCSIQPRPRPQCLRVCRERAWSTLKDFLWLRFASYCRKIVQNWQSTIIPSTVCMHLWFLPQILNVAYGRINIDWNYYCCYQFRVLNIKLDTLEPDSILLRIKMVIFRMSIISISNSRLRYEKLSHEFEGCRYEEVQYTWNSLREI